MSPTLPKTTKPSDVIRAFVDHPVRVAVPVVVFALLALVYSLVRTPVWEASQAMVVRDEAGGSGALTRPGKFGHLDDMKTTQETLLELAKSRGVLRAALIEVGPPANYRDVSAWPTASDVEDLQGIVKLSPPKGAEFGKTEVFYLRASGNTKDRAVALASAVCRHLQRSFEQLRDAKAKSIAAELEKTVALAKGDLNDATRALTVIEQRVGPDLSELRILNEMPSGDSDLRRTTLEVEKELRTYRAAQDSNRELLKLLAAAEVDPGRLLASPSRLLKSQPGLDRLKSGLIDAQLRTAQLQGTRSDLHPQVRAAMAAEQEISKHLHDELSIAIKGVEVDLRLTADRVESLEKQRDENRARLNRLAGLRAEYSNLVATARHRTEILKTVQQELADAQASRAAAFTASLVNLIDQPDAGSRATGPGKATIVLGGLLCGLLMGGAIVFLTVQPGTQPESNGHPTRSLAEAFGIERPSLTVKQALRKLIAAKASYN